MRVLFALFATFFAAQAMAADAPLTKPEVEKIIREYLVNNPDVLEEAFNKLRDKKQAEAASQMKDGVSKNHAELFDDTTSPAIGAKTPDVTLVEFFDYHCGYCKHVLPTITQLVKEDPKVRVIFREFPILSEDSATAAKAALAVHRISPDKYFAFHSALMNEKGKFDEAQLLEIGKKQGIDSVKLKAEMNKPEVATILDKNRELAGKLGVRGTPAIAFSDDQMVPGAVQLEDLKEMVKKAREAKK